MPLAANTKSFRKITNRTSDMRRSNCRSDRGIDLTVSTVYHQWVSVPCEIGPTPVDEPVELGRMEWVGQALLGVLCLLDFSLWFVVMPIFLFLGLVAH